MNGKRNLQRAKASRKSKSRLNLGTEGLYRRPVYESARQAARPVTVQPVGPVPLVAWDRNTGPQVRVGKAWRAACKTINLHRTDPQASGITTTNPHQVSTCPTATASDPTSTTSKTSAGRRRKWRISPHAINICSRSEGDRPTPEGFRIVKSRI